MINGMDLFSSHLPARPSHAVHRLKKFQLQEYWCSWDRVRSKTTEQTLLFTEDLIAKSMQELLRIYPRWTWDRFGRLMWSSRKWMWSPVVTILTCAASAVSADTKPTHHYFCFPLFKLTKKIKFSFKRNLSKWREKQPQVPDWIYTTSGDSFKACNKAIVRFLFNRWSEGWVFPKLLLLVCISSALSLSPERDGSRGWKELIKKLWLPAAVVIPLFIYPADPEANNGSIQGFSGVPPFTPHD